MLLSIGCGSQTPAADPTVAGGDPASSSVGQAPPPPTSEVDIYFGLLEEASAALDNGDFEDAMAAYRATLAMAEAREDLAGQSSIHRRMGVVYYSEGRMEEALEEYEQAVDFARAVKAFALEGNALRNIGIVHFDRGEYEEAIEFYNLALVAAQQSAARERDPALEGDVEFSLGKAFHLNGDLSLALQHYERAATIYHQLNILPLHGSVLRNIGIVYDMQEYNEAALTYYQQAIEIALEIGDEVFEDDLRERIEGLSQ
jgi:tetratricopeptide (TPR) repeat protein